MKPAVNFVLHAHLPWVKRAGRWPFGEEWLFEAILGCYIPLLNMLGRLRAAGVRSAITLGVTPVLIEMLRDAYLTSEFDRYLQSRLSLADADIARFRSKPEMRALALGVRAGIEEARRLWNTVYERDLVGAIRPYAQTGEIEMITSAATHAYLPLLHSEREVEAQLAIGMQATANAFGVTPRGVWLPECAFDPSLIGPLERCGFEYFFADERAAAAFGARFFERPWRLPDSTLAYFLRHPLARGDVMDDDLGYAGHADYQEFYRRDEHSGARYWRVTDRELPLFEKAPYEPGQAQRRARVHAADFAAAIERIPDGEATPFVTLTFDAELFGHWWAEGITWLEQTVLLMQRASVAQFRTPSEVLATAHLLPNMLPRSSWGIGGDDRVWKNAATQTYWDDVYSAQTEFASMLRSSGERPALVEQARRELLLIQSSDWPFLTTGGQAGTFGRDRAAVHLSRFRETCRAARGHAHDASIVSQARRDDTLFDSRVLAAGAPVRA